MPLTVAELARLVAPARTNLLLGAGASIPSGGLSGIQLADYLSTELSGAATNTGKLDEISSILCMKYGRAAVLAKIRQRLRALEPTGGLLALPNFPWVNVYTTNYDQLMEVAYRRQNKQLTTIRSNYDWSSVELAQGTVLFKLHGCLTQDEVDGHRAKMILTEDDYAEASKYREALFKRLSLDLTTRDVVIIGHSLADPDLKELMTQALRLQRDAGGTGRLFALVYNADPDRAQLLENRGFRIAFGGIDEFVHALASVAPAPAEQFSLDLPVRLPSTLLASSISVSHALMLEENATKLYNGSPAQYADIRKGLTFERSQETIVETSFAVDGKFICVIIGAAGVGKTTLARRLVWRFAEEGGEAWEHNSDFAFSASAWTRIEAGLAAEGKTGWLLIDNSVDFQRQTDILVDALAKKERPALRLIFTAPRAQWGLRTKSSNIFARGFVVELSQLDLNELNGLLFLLDTNQQISALVDRKFSQLGRHERLDHLKRRCSADMFVCLKNIFAFERLDTIILREYADLSEAQQDVLRHVAALEAAGAKVHRQLIIRLLGITPTYIQALLTELDGILDEYEISARDGIYGWNTRHLVIAGIIAEFKFSQQSEIIDLYHRVVNNLNPSIHTELRAMREICHAEFGIDRISDWRERVSLYREIIAVAPGERVPYHRLVSTYLRNDLVEEADMTIRDAELAVGIDSPISRYKVRSAILRSENTPGIRPEDRIAMLHQAENIALAGIRRFPADKYAYIAYCQVGSKLLAATGDNALLATAIAKTRAATEHILDPDMERMVSQFEDELRHSSRRRS